MYVGTVCTAVLRPSLKGTFPPLCWADAENNVLVLFSIRRIYQQGQYVQMAEEVYAFKEATQPVVLLHCNGRALQHCLADNSMPTHA